MSLQLQKTEQMETGLPVYANIYHFWGCFNRFCSCFSLGVYHTGIEIDGSEYMYYGFDGEQSGLIAIYPQSANYEFEQRVLLGYTNYSYYKLQKQVIDPLEMVFIGNRYDLLNNNCNHFAHQMSRMLGMQDKFPQKVFKITNCLNFFRCCIPNCILNGRLQYISFLFRKQQDYENLEEQIMENYLQK